MPKLSWILIPLFLVSFLMSLSHSLKAADSLDYATRGVSRVMKGAVSVPSSLVQDSKRTVFPFGILKGAVRGTLNAIVWAVGGAVDIVRGAAPYAKYLLLT